MPRESISRLEFTELARAAGLAPSPDNNQPLRLAVEDNQLVIHPDIERGLPSDVGSMFMMLALGAAAENACLAARQMGYAGRVSCRSAAAADLAAGASLLDAPPPSVAIDLEPGGEPDPLFPYLSIRCTCRKWYSTRALDAADAESMTQSIAAFSVAALQWLTDRPGIGRLARLVAAADLVRLQHRPFHEELYRQLRFSAEEAERTRDGLDLRTLELPPGAGALLKALRRWPRMQLVHRLGLGWMLSAPSAAAVKRSGAVGVLTVAAPTAEQYLEGGRALQRIWLTAAARGLAMQPLGSLPIFLAHLEQAQGRELKPQQRDRLARIVDAFYALAPEAKGRVLLMLFRIGYGAAPSHRSLRRPVEEFFEGSPS